MYANFCRGNFTRLTVMVAVALLMVACTRERPLPEPTATAAIADAGAGNGAAAPTSSTPAGSSTEDPAEPEVITDTEAGEANLAVTNTPAPTATEGTQELFEYTVEAGDTLGLLAERFGTDMQTLRDLNQLESDGLFVGQLLNVPYVEGITAEGLPTPTPGPFRYTIQPGDTLSSLAAEFGVDPIQIIEANNLLSPDNLTVGVEIVVPGYQPSDEDAESDGEATDEGGDDGETGDADEDSIVHVVQPGEGLIEIAARYGVTIDEIATANGLADRDILRVGQELTIPGVSAEEAAEASGAVHVVQPGESLLGIAVNYGVTVEEILEINELDNPDSILEGQELIIPSP